MIHVECPELHQRVKQRLSYRQQHGSGWKHYNPARVVADREMRQTLSDAFNGKCGYCECIEATTIDHFWPQSGYPHKIWDWENFIWSCDVCQRYKTHTSPVDEQGTHMVNPREDEPLRYVRIDGDTGIMYASRDSTQAEQRGRYTIQVLHLDQRPDLDRQRQQLYFDVLNWITEIVDPASTSERRDYAWERLQQKLHERQPYLAVIQHMFTIPSEFLLPLIERLYAVKPESYEFFARFRLY